MIARFRAVSLGVLYSLLLFGLAGCPSNYSSNTPAQTEPPPATPAPTPPRTPVIEKELMITDLQVVNDARAEGEGPWSFGGLMKQLSGSADPQRVSAFIIGWLSTWEKKQTVNTFEVPARPNIRSLVIDPWKVKDGVAASLPDAQWQPKLENAPFRLLAIVYRPDLHLAPDGNVKTAGEGRFVFGVLGPNGQSLPFTTILEYELLGTSQNDLKKWAADWHALGDLPFGPQYNAALQAVTDRFSGAGKAPGKPNGSPLNQLRTNEIALSFPGGWELREFQISAADGLLHQVTVKQTPANSFNDSADLTAFIDRNTVDLLDGNLVIVGEKLQDGKPFLGGASLVAPPSGPGFVWKAGAQNNEARHRLAFLTCNGCHHLETGTRDFLHIHPRAANQPAALSKFLTGIEDVPDPVNANEKRDFGDLAERAEVLTAILGGTAGGQAPAVVLQNVGKSRAGRVH